MSYCWHLTSIICLLASALGVADDATIVRTETGLIRGEVVDVQGTQVRVFRGIPFAAPPVAGLRWRPPQPGKPWEDVRECRKFGPACPQPPDRVYASRFGEQSEDCLYLNVWTTAGEASQKRPVMVWIHGGGNLIGGAASPVYDGRYLAAAGVVLVSIQYRLGPFGYLAHPALTAEAKTLDGRESSGNYGLMDQIAALKWVQTHAAAFGGDKDRVTIFGESAGAANVTHLMASPLAKGLFHRAIAQSGYFGENTLPLNAHPGSRRSAHQTGVEFASRLGVQGEDAAALRALRALPPDKLLSVPLTIGGMGGLGERAIRLSPVVDKYVLPREPGEVWAGGQMHRVPFIAGSNLDDGSVFSRAQPIKRLTGYRLTANLLFGGDASRVLELFPAKSDEEVPAAVHRVITTMAFRAPARRLVRWIDAASAQAWLYHFSHKPGKGRATKEGVFHGLEIPYVFGTLTAFGDATDKAVSDDMRRRWVTFARDGDPNGRAEDAPGSFQPRWPAYHKAEDRHLELGDQPSVGQGLDRDPCAVMDRIASRHRNQ